MTRRNITFLLLFGVAWFLGAWLAARMLIVEVAIRSPDALVVFSGSATHIERVNLAAELYAERRAPKIILTNDNEQAGWSNELRRNPLFVERSIEQLLRAGVPRASIEVLPNPVSSTYQEAVMFRDYALLHQMKSLLAITSAYHSRRALWTLRRVFAGTGIEVGIKTVPPGLETPSPPDWWLYWMGWQMVPAEHIKLLVYELRYK